MSANNTTILIKRSFANNTPTPLKEGELAYSFASNNLFIGNASNSAVLIGGANIVARVVTIESGVYVAPAYDQANTAQATAVSAYNQANTALGVASGASAAASAATVDAALAANTVRVSANGGSVQTKVGLNFVNTSSVLVDVTSGSTGNANVALSVSSNLFVEVLRANGWIDFTKTLDAAEPPYKEGRVWYNANTGTLQLNSINSSLDLRFGDQLWFYGLNKSGSIIPKGSPVHISGTDLDSSYGQVATIELADASNVTKKDVIGLTAYEVQPNQLAHIVVHGYVFGLNTSNLTTSQRCHLDWSNQGKLVDAAASYPNYPMEVGTCIQSDTTNGIVFVDIKDHTFERIRVVNESYFDSDVNVYANVSVAGDQTTTGNIYASGINLLPAIRSAANTTQVYANNTLKVSNAALNFNNTSTIRVDVVSNGNGRANISFDYIGAAGGIASFPTKATGGTVVSANGLNFVNSATVGITVTQGTTGNANISFTTLTGGGTITQLDTGLGLTGGPITNSGTIRANVANTTVQGITKLIDVVNSTDSANAATANSVKVTFDQATSAYGQANTANTTAVLAYGQANAAYTQANTANSIAISAYGQANLAYTQANTANSIAISAYGQANLAYSQANTANSIAISAYGQANAAFTAANNAANTVRVTANSGLAQSAVSLNFINTASVLVSVGAGSAGNANVAFNAVAGTTAVAGILQLTDSITSTSTTTAATPNSVKSAFDQGTLAYGQANAAYTQANAANSIAISAYGQANAAFTAANNAANTVRVTANSGSAQSAVSLNFVNTSTVTVSISPGAAGIANIAFTSTAAGSGGGGTANLSVSDTPPVSPSANNTLWWQSNTGSLKIYYSDGDSSQWVDAFVPLSSSGGGSFSGTVDNINVTNSLLITNAASVVANSNQFFTGGAAAGSKALFTANALIKDILTSSYYSTRSQLGDPGTDFTSYANGTKVLYHYGAFQNTTFDAANNDLSEQYGFYASDLTGAPLKNTPTPGNTVNYAFSTNINTRNGTLSYAFFASGNASSIFNGPVLVQGANVIASATVYANGGSVQHAKSLNFVNTAAINVSVTSGSTGNANIAFSYNPSGLYTIWVPATSMFPRSSNGANAVWTEGTTNKINMRTFDFSNTTQTFTQFSIRMPKAWDRGTIQYEPSWTAFAGSGTVSWNVAAVAFSDNDWLDGTAMGTPRTSTDTLTNFNYLHVGPQPATPITVAGTPQAGDVIWFEVSRDVSGTTIAANTKLIGVTLFINVNAKDDT